MEPVSLLLRHSVSCKKVDGQKEKVSPVENFFFECFQLFPEFLPVCVTCSLSVLSQFIPQLSISAGILARVAAQKWLRHWKAIMKRESCLCAVCVSSFPPLLSLVFGFLWLLVSFHPLTSLPTPLLFKRRKRKNPSLAPPSSLSLYGSSSKRAGLFS